MKHKGKAYTLAEVLITIGIIGVISAITIPNLITKYQKQRVQTRLKGFVSIINNAVRLSMIDNGDVDGWVQPNKYYSYKELEEFMHQYFLPYMKYVDLRQGKSFGSGYEGICITLLDGSLFCFAVDNNGADIGYYVDGDESHGGPRNYFQFQFAKYKSDSNRGVNSASYIEPYIYNWNGKREQLKDGNTWACKVGCTNCGYCTKLIQLNSWKIPDDYPWKWDLHVK